MPAQPAQPVPAVDAAIKDHADYIAHLLMQQHGGKWRVAIDLAYGLVLIVEDR